MNMPKTRTDDTEARYTRMGQGVFTRYTRIFGLRWSDDPIAFARWFCSLRSGWRSSYWRLMRAAMKFAMTERDAPREAVDLLDDPALSVADTPNTTIRRAKTYRSPKRITEEVLSLYIEALRKSRGELSDLIAAFLYVNPEIGLRPKEWGTATLGHLLTETGESVPILTVINAKNTNGRSTGPTRTLILDEVVETMIRAAFILRDEAITRADGWSIVQKKMALALGDFRRAHRLPPINLYSTRHQFAANAKSAGFSKREIADMMGHESDKTAGRHYGKKRCGRGFLRVTPLSNTAPIMRRDNYQQNN